MFCLDYIENILTTTQLELNAIFKKTHKVLPHTHVLKLFCNQYI